jgi:EAL domain-containing protein (putative c-di-GMP-specific phosphodiesterase class I)
VIGLAVAAIPIIGLNILLAANLIATSQREVDGVAAEVLAIAESRIDDLATTLIGLGLKGVSTCSEYDEQQLRDASQRAAFADEVAVVDGQNAALCSAFGTPRVVRLTSAEHGTISPEMTLSTVAIGENGSKPFIRLLWRRDAERGLRVLAAGDKIFPTFLKSRLTAAFIAQLVTVDNSVVIRQFLDPTLTEDLHSILPPISASAASQRYPLRVDIEVPGAALARANQSLFLYANFGGLVFALFVAAMSILMNRRTGGPIREIADGIRRGEFVPYYQPVLDIGTGRLVGCEVLVRWRRRDGAVISPSRFIGLAEASGQIFPLTVSLMEKARDDVAHVYVTRPELKLGFNLFAGHFDDTVIVDEVQRIFWNGPIRMTQLMFEVTERQPLNDIRRARLVIAKLQALGARVALDDVGTGHGGLSYLLKLGVDVMKMDKMFVDAIGTDRYSVAIVDSLVKLATDMNLELIAEGVETFEQVQYLRAKGVRLAQGYVFAPPLPASAFLTLVAALSPAERREPETSRYVGSLRHTSSA